MAKAFASLNGKEIEVFFTLDKERNIEAGWKARYVESGRSVDLQRENTRHKVLLEIQDALDTGDFELEAGDNQERVSIDPQTGFADFDD